jgi:hypothetical protein
LIGQWHPLGGSHAGERVLYPAVARLYGNPDGTATMSYDHRAIGEQIGALATADPADTAAARLGVSLLACDYWVVSSCWHALRRVVDHQ